MHDPGSVWPAAAISDDRVRVGPVTAKMGARQRVEHPMLWPLAAACLLWAAVSACGEGAGGFSTATTIDSAGVTIVQSTVPVRDRHAVWTISTTPAMRLGGLDAAPEYEFYNVTGGLVLPGGGIVIANEGSSELRFYDAAGRHVRSVGRNGSGPGEFRNLYALVHFGADSLAVWDSGNARWSVHDLEGSFARTFRLTAPDGKPYFPGEDPVVFADRSVLAFAGSNMMEEPSGVFEQDVQLRRFGSDGVFLNDVVEVTLFRMRIQRGQIRSAMTRIPFSARSQFSTTGNAFWVGRQEDYSVELYDPGGGLMRIVRDGSYSPVPITAQHIERERVARLDTMRAMLERMPMMGRAWLEAQEKNLATLEFPEHFPAYSEIMSDAEENLWVQGFPLPGEPPPPWSVFDGQGRLLGLVSMPDGVKPLEITGAYLLGLTVDDLGLEYVVLHTISKADVKSR
jgi:hypothetical protein